MLRAALDLLVPAACWSCGARAPDGGPLCLRCEHALPWLGGSPELEGIDVVWTPLAFHGPARDLVHALKFRAAAGLSGAMAGQIVAGAPEGLLAPPCAIVPVPAHPWRRRLRGFDHAEALAHAIGRVSGRPVVPALRRSGGAFERQRGLGRAERLAGERVTIEARGGAVPLSVVLADDVRTTGATLARCASVLRAAGALQVKAVTYAHAV